MSWPVGPSVMTVAGRVMRVASPIRPASRVPVIIGLAGYDQSAAAFDSIARLTSRLGSGALVLVGEGLGSPLAWQFKEGQTRDVDWLRAVISQATASCGDPSRVMLAGLSDGGVMAVRGACSIGVTSLVTSSASSKPPAACKLPRTMLAEHGTNDTFDPYDGDGKDIPPARPAIAAWGESGHCTGSQETAFSQGKRLVYTGCTAMTSVELVTLEGYPHGWPQGYDLTGRLLGQLGGAPVSSAALPAFSASVSGALTAGDLPHSWRTGCPVSPAQLRKLTMTYYGFDGAAHTGVLVVNADSATSVVSVFRQLYANRYPIRRMTPVDDYNGSDDASTTADNTAGFNCRAAVGGSGGWSQHAYGHAIDIDPVENPYIDNGQVLPANGKPYADRSKTAPGMIHAGDATFNAFYAIGWKWGGYFAGTPDYQHFSSTGT